MKMFGREFIDALQKWPVLLLQTVVELFDSIEGAAFLEELVVLVIDISHKVLSCAAQAGASHEWSVLTYLFDDLEDKRCRFCGELLRIERWRRASGFAKGVIVELFES
jgi:hypothetical protein